MTRDDELSEDELARLDLERLVQWAEVLDDASYYEILDLSPDAGLEAVRAAFHRFALGFHPDAFHAADDGTRAEVRRVFERGVEAYRALADPTRRSDYDLALAKGQLRLGRQERHEGVGVGAKSLDEVCRAPGAKLHARHSSELISEGKLKEATFELWRALRAEDGPNPELIERIQALEAMMRHGA
jgi:curved DNA-binding protein CbpA